MHFGKKEQKYQTFNQNLAFLLGEGGGLSFPFSKIGKKCPNFEIMS